MYASYGQYGAYGQYGSGGGVLLPAATADILQWLKGVDPDGISILDRKGEVNLTEPEVRDVNVASFALSADYIETDADIGWVAASGEFDIRFTAKQGVGGQTRVLFGRTNNGVMIQFAASEAQIQVVLWNSVGTVFVNSTISLGGASTLDWNSYHLKGTGSLVELYMNGSETPTSQTSAFSPAPTGIDFVSELNVGHSDATGYVGEVSNVSVGRDGGSTNIDLILLIGQSNAQGRPDEDNPAYLDGQTHRFSYQVEGGVPIIAYDQNLTKVGATIWGAELEAGYQITQNLSRQVAFVKVTKGSTNMYADWQKGGAMYQDLLTIYKTAINDWLAKGYTPVIREAWLLQGESDATAGAGLSNANAWAANARQMITDLKADLGISVPWVVARINSVSALQIYGDEVKAQQDLLGQDDDITVFSTDDLAMKDGDDAHYTPESLITIGQRFYESGYNTSTADTSDWKQIEMACEEGSGATTFDVSGQNKHGTLTGGWTTADGIPSWNHEKGFKVVTPSTAPYIPALADGSAAADGSAITNPGGYVHNGSEVTLQQTDADTDAFGGATIWGLGGVNPWLKVSYADFLAYVNGTNNSWLKWKSVNGVCLLYEAWQYLQTKSLTEGEYNKNVSYVGGASCGEGIVPFP